MVKDNHEAQIQGYKSNRDKRKNKGQTTRFKIAPHLEDRMIFHLWSVCT